MAAPRRNSRATKAQPALKAAETVARKDRALFEQVYAEMCRGTKSEDIADLLGVELETFMQIRSKVLQEKGAALRQQTPEVIYAGYVADTRTTLRIVDEGIDEMMSALRADPKGAGRVGPALASLVRARHDMLGDTIKMGQTLGIVDKQDPEGQKIGGVVIAGVTDSQIRQFIQDELAKLMDLSAMQVPIEMVEIGELHYGEAGRHDEIKVTPESAVVEEEPE